MRAFRTHIRSAVAATLLLQLAAYLALPTALCCEPQHEMAAAASTVERGASPTKACCPGMSPGQMCPMHGGSSTKPRAKDSDCRIKCARGSELSVPVQAFAGPLVTPILVDPAFAAGDFLSLLSIDTAGVTPEPTSPPPRPHANA
jgi:hypothetical protein